MDRHLDPNSDVTSAGPTKRESTRVLPSVVVARRSADSRVAVIASVLLGLGCGASTTPSVETPQTRPDLDVTVVPHFEGSQLVLETTVVNRAGRELVVYPKYLVFELLSVSDVETHDTLIAQLNDVGSEALSETSCVDEIGVQARPGDVLRFTSRYDLNLEGLESAEIEVETTACITYTDLRCEDESEKVCSHSTRIIVPRASTGP